MSDKKTTYDNLEQMFLIMDEVEAIDDNRRFYPDEEECKKIEEDIDTYYDLLVYLCTVNIKPITEEEKESVVRINAILNSHTHIEE